MIKSVKMRNFTIIKSKQITFLIQIDVFAGAKLVERGKKCDAEFANPGGHFLQNVWTTFSRDAEHCCVWAAHHHRTDDRRQEEQRAADFHGALFFSFFFFFTCNDKVNFRMLKPDEFFSFLFIAL